jgi:hypothetical protein
LPRRSLPEIASKWGISWLFGPGKGRVARDGVYVPGTNAKKIASGGKWGCIVQQPKGKTEDPVILSIHLQTRNVLAVLAVFPAVAAISVFMLGRIHRRILGREAMEAPTESVIADDAAAKAGSD